MISQNAYSSCLVVQQNKITQNKELYSFLNNYKNIKIFIDEGITDPMSEQSRKYIDEERRLGVRAQAAESMIEYTLPDKSVETCILLMLPNNMENSKNIVFNNSWNVIVKNSVGYNVRIIGKELSEQVKKAGYPIYTRTEVLEFPKIKIGSCEKKIEINNGAPAKVNIQFDCEDECLYVNEHKYALAYHIYDCDGRLKLWDGKRMTVSSVYNGMKTTIMIDEELLRQPGHYIVKIDMVEEGKQWLSNYCVELPEIHIFVK